MTQEEYEKLDCYDRLNLVLATCGQVSMGLETIIDEHAAYDYILELIESLEPYIPLFSSDPEINYSHITNVEFRDMMEIIPLLKQNNASYTYLLDMLKSIEREVEKKLPDNVRLARFFDRIVANKQFLAKTCGIDEETLFNVIDKMRANTDAVSDIIKNSPKEKKVNNK